MRGSHSRGGPAHAGPARRGPQGPGDPKGGQCGWGVPGRECGGGLQEAAEPGHPARGAGGVGRPSGRGRERRAVGCCPPQLPNTGLTCAACK